MKSQRETKNLGIINIPLREEKYKSIEKIKKFHICIDKTHVGERTIPIRNFYLDTKKDLQNACIECQTRYRKQRIHKCKNKYLDKSNEEIYTMYINNYGEHKKCSRCKISKCPSDFITSRTMECGLHNHCKLCCIEINKKSSLRDFIYFPDKDNVNYKKKPYCESCFKDTRLSIDHIVPISLGGSDCFINKRTLCIHCNSKKNSKFPEDFSIEYVNRRYKTKIQHMHNKKDIEKILREEVDKSKKKYFTSKEIYTKYLTSYVKKNNLKNNICRIVDKLIKVY